MSSKFERIGHRSIYDGKVFSVRSDRIRYEDGEEVEREFVGHPGAVGVVVLDEHQQLWFVRQPREAVDIPDLLEIVGLPASRIGDIAADRGIPLHELTPTTGSLEDAYLALTGDAVEYRTKEIA